MSSLGENEKGIHCCFKLLPRKWLERAWVFQRRATAASSETKTGECLPVLICDKLNHLSVGNEEIRIDWDSSVSKVRENFWGPPSSKTSLLLWDLIYSLTNFCVVHCSFWTDFFFHTPCVFDINTNFSTSLFRSQRLLNPMNQQKKEDKRPKGQRKKRNPQER